MAIQADNDLAFRSSCARAMNALALHARLARGQHRHDGAPLLLAHGSPAGDLIERAGAADTEPRIGVDHTDVYARRFQGVSFCSVMT
jgi:hypothetical protein